MHVAHFVADTQIHAWHFLFIFFSHLADACHRILPLCSIWPNDACRANLCTNTGAEALYYPIKWCMSYTHRHTHTSFVLCDQMMHVAVKLVTSIQQCPILFCSHPYCATVLLMLCKHISTLCIPVTLHCSPMKYGCKDALYVWEIITYHEILRREPSREDRYSLCIIHFSCF